MTGDVSYRAHNDLFQVEQDPTNLYIANLPLQYNETQLETALQVRCVRAGRRFRMANVVEFSTSDVSKWHTTTFAGLRHGHLHQNPAQRRGRLARSRIRQNGQQGERVVW